METPSMKTSENNPDYKVMWRMFLAIQEFI